MVNTFIKFSVIIPVRNGEAFIISALDSAINQTYIPYEIIVVDNESTDETRNIIHKYIQLNGNLKYILQTDKGVAGGRNTGISMATGDYIAFLDADDVWYPTKLEETAKELLSGADLVYHDQAVRHHGKIVRIFKNKPYVQNMYKKLLYGRNCLSVSTVTVRATIFTELGLFIDDDYVEDYEMWLRIAKHGYDFHNIPKVLGEYTIHSNNLSHNILKMMEHELDMIKHYLQTTNLRERLLAYYKLGYIRLKFFKQYILSKVR